MIIFQNKFFQKEVVVEELLPEFLEDSSEDKNDLNDTQDPSVTIEDKPITE